MLKVKVKQHNTNNNTLRTFGKTLQFSNLISKIQAL